MKTEQEQITALEMVALEFARAFYEPHGSIQEHNTACAIASAQLIAAAMEVERE